MTTARVLNDGHVGVNRSAGTTATTQMQLRQHLLSEHERLMPDGKDVIFNGDLFDTNNIPMADVAQMFRIISNWMVRNPGHILYNSAGNHDLSKNDSVLSSFQFLGRLLSLVHPSQYVHIEVPTMTPYGYIIPHLRNQDLFDLALSNVPECQTLLLHCNYDNGFAAQSDHSLNISQEQVDALDVDVIIVAHEHHPRRKGRVIVTGNQMASSVSDWKQDAPNKHCVEINSEDGEINFYPTADKSREFVEMPWDALEETDHKFIRVTGRVAAEDASRVLTALNRFRQASAALVITNAVQFVSEDNQAVMESTLEDVQNFSVWGALESLFTPEEFKLLQAIDKKEL